MAVVVAAWGCSATPDALDRPLAAAGDAARGRDVFVSRDAGHCVLCHSAPGVAVAGSIGPPLAGVGSRLTAAQIRIRIVDITQVNPGAAMPVFHRADRADRVSVRWVNRPVLDAQQVEDLVALLETFK